MASRREDRDAPRTESQIGRYQSTTGPRVLVAGGSMGGLNAALYLRDAGCDVDVYERSRTPLQGKGAGIVLHPATARYFTDNDTLDLDEISISSHWLRYMGRDGSTIDEQPCDYRFISYTTLYRGLLNCFDEDRYHLGEEVIGFEQDSDRVTVHLTSGRDEYCDLLVCADGIQSTGRRLMLPDATPEYAGYVAWRGTVEETELSSETFDALHEAITYYLMPNGHLLAYPIPGEEGVLESGRNLANWLLYLNVAEGEELDDLRTDREGALREISLGPAAVQKKYIENLRDFANSELPPPLAELVLKTAEPFIQVVFDVEVPRMAFGRVGLIGDAAFAARPHAAAGTAKAAENARKLGEAMLHTNGDELAALERWEPSQVELSRQVLARSREAGKRLQAGRSRAGEPLPFGLYQVGDSIMH